MTQSELDKVISLLSDPDKFVKELQKSSFDLPKWSDLEKQYNPDKHAILTDLNRYPFIKNPDTGGDDMKRITRGLQRLAVNRTSQAMFSTPVIRQYDYNRDDENENLAVDILEMIYSTHNYIDAENIERSKKLNASCQVATIWKAKEKKSKVKGIESKFSLIHTTYSEKDGYILYPQVDENGDLIVLSIEYVDSSDMTHFDVYAGGDNPLAIYLVKKDKWELAQGIKNPQNLSVFPVVYGNIKEPVWGGNSGTRQVENIEETISYRAYYVKKNASPTHVLDVGDTTGMQGSTEKEKDTDKKRVLKVGRGGSVNPVIWDSNNKAVQDHIDGLISAFFEDNQIPDTSFKNMLNSNTSAENKEIVFTDSKNKAIDLGGEWQRLFYNEMNIVIEYAKIMFPSLATAFDNISVKSIIKPYNIKSEIDNANFVATAGSSMSLSTKVRKLNQVQDVESEVAAIQEEQAASANQGFL